MVTEIADIVGKSTDAASRSGALLSSRIQTFLNFAQKRIARHYSFHELNALSTTSATVSTIKEYPLESGTNNLGLANVKDISSIRLVDGENSRKLERWSYRKFDAHYPRPENYANARPSLYIRWVNKLELFRVPNDAYTLHIRYSKWPTDFSSGSQTSDYLNKDQLILTGGVLETYLALEEYVDARVWYERFLGQLKDAVDVEGDVDWEPEAEQGAIPAYRSGEPWLDPHGSVDDPLWGYP